MVRNLVLRSLVTMGLLLPLAFYFGLNSILGALVEVSPGTIVACLALMSVSMALGILRWHLCLRDAGVEATPRALSQAFLLGNVSGRFLFAGAGEISRGGLLILSGGKPAAVIASLVAERIYALGALLIFLPLSIYVLARDVHTWPQPGDLPLSGDIYRITVPIAIAATLLVFLVLCKTRLWHSIASLLQMAYQALPRRFSVLPFLLTMLTWSISFTCVTLLAVDLGVAAPIRLILAIQPFVTLVAILPISLGGWGVREVGMLGGFTLVGIPPDQAIAVSVMFGILLTGFTLVGGCLGLYLQLHARHR